jgi:DNA repair exonuclease SbcCD ATPase subunit
LQELDAERRTLQAEVAPEETIEEPKQEEDSDMTIPEVTEHSLSDSEDAAPRLRRAAERVLDRKRKRDQVDVKAKAKKAKAATTKLSKAELKLRKLEADIEAKKNEIRDCEDAVQDVNNDLRETDCQRTRCLGRDRFCNRYYWFERNGMPFSGVPMTSTAHYGYANGRLWIQGPDEMEREGFLELTKEDQERYKEKFSMTVLERVEAEEGDTHLHNANNWGYFDDAESVDNLIAWLDDRGLREKALRKELQGWRDTMVEYMDKLKSHLGDAPDDATGPAPTSRVSTRTKTYVSLEATKWVCLKWHNSLAIDQIGMRHSDGMRKRRKEVKKPADKKGKGGSRKR